MDQYELDNQHLPISVLVLNAKFCLSVGGEPVLQVIDIKHLPAAGGPGRYRSNERTNQNLQGGEHTTAKIFVCRLVVSDSQYYQQAMLATQLNELVTSGVYVI